MSTSRITVDPARVRETLKAARLRARHSLSQNFLVEMRDHLTYRLLGQTVDDAAGEAFDKVGRLLGLGYPGGPAIMRAAADATNHDVAFPRAWLGDSYDFSFSGLKTAARRIVDAARADEGLPSLANAGAREESGSLSAPRQAALAYGFQEAVVDVLVAKTMRAARETGARSIVPFDSEPTRAPKLTIWR